MNEQKDWLGRGWAYPVQVDRLTGGVEVSEYEIDIHQAIRIMLGTARGERVMRPDFGCGIHDLVFAPRTAGTLGEAMRRVSEALRRWEPRIEVLAVDAQPHPGEPNGILIAIHYEVRATSARQNLVYPFYLAT